jgi:CHAT domain
MSTFRILLAVPDQDVTDLLRDALSKITLPEGTRLVAYVANHEAQAREYLQDRADSPYGLVIAYLGLPINAHAPRNDKDQRGLVLLQVLKTIDPQVPSILISPIEEPSLFRQLQALGEPIPELVREDSDMFDTIVAYSTSVIAGIQTSLPQKRLRVTVTLRPGDGGNVFGWAINVLNTRESYQGDLRIREEALQDIVDESIVHPLIEAYPLWERALQRIGRRLREEIFNDNWEFRDLFSQLLGSTGNAEICFDISRDVHPALLEALIEPDRMKEGAGTRTPPRFWMFRAPIYRRLFRGDGGERYPLFHGRARIPINCLIIESDVSGIVPQIKDSDGRSLTLGNLQNVIKEAEWLEQYLKKMKPSLELGEIKRINREEADKLGVPLKELLRSTLQGQVEWHLVHYAGHCRYDAGQKTGFLFFPGDPFIDPLHLADFSAWLRKTRFVYLSGCESSEEDFVFELARNSIPAVFGFRWKILDKLAVEFTKSFYTNLFERMRSLEYAFLLARKEMRSKFANERIWAAPILILQINQCDGPECSFHDSMKGVPRAVELKT